MSVIPSTIKEAGELIKSAAASAKAITLWGNGTFQDFGNPPQRADIVLGTRGLAGIIEHEPADLTITLGAGTTFQEAEDHLGRHGQRLPWEVPFPDKTTIGGAIAVNMSGPSRYRWGTARDFLIGAKVILANGMLIKNGGKVTKNVTGYDLKKIFIGSLGTLGLIAEATLKVIPRSSDSTTVNATFSSTEDLFAVLASPELPFLFPEALDFWKLKEGWGLSARFTGTLDAMKRQIETLTGICKTGRPATMNSLKADVEARWWDRVLHAPFAEIPASIRLRFSVPPASLGRFVLTAFRLFPEALFCGRAGQGVGWIMIPEAILKGVQDPRLKELTGLAQALSGTLFLEACPAPWKETLDVWLTPLPEAFLLSRIKKAFDPQGTFSPGRFAGKI